MSTEQVGSGDEQAQRLARLLRLPERREPAVAEVATWVGLGIIEGRLSPGQDLNTVELARRFKSSRTPIREALMVLEQEGLVEIKARRRPRVATFSLDEVRQMYAVRQHLLSLVARLIVEHATDDQLAELRDDVEAMNAVAAKGDTDGYFWKHVAWQEKLTEYSGNPTLKGIMDTLALRTLILRRLSLHAPTSLAESIRWQEQIQDAFEARDAELAGLLLARTARAALRSIEQAHADGELRWPEHAGA
ncbi:DNA-binding GntR family transcriptional regulator [Amycolatopsis bartoniae]|uniref:GntR family transcriptional regulator n=1 Tax=Amycolatopsis bartoniae TaxID=941986 RepID=A0A8H9INA1_9PSEU|nr:GntR family transcriptional regulator [Amycolatopsis bartoniae]MBB2940256.1 DNA-binding GntR family transcriptional regulator [Amycolatopsis bartoniae]TVT10164.1 GntR family transcriptional regulator [Amycolatopsis bartoniae]GHF35212.1 GntR family transcriptional regulator [Amycolatopsis bartoniae]